MKAEEIEFLRYFYDAAGDCFGPADSDIYDAIKQNFIKKTGKEMPEGYEVFYDY